jgi:hypothetical protein
MGMKLNQFRFDETTLQRLDDIHLAMASAYGMDVARGLYAERRNGLTRTECLRRIIDETWTRLNDEGKITKDRRQLKCTKCDGRGHIASRCPWVD